MIPGIAVGGVDTSVLAPIEVATNEAVVVEDTPIAHALCILPHAGLILPLSRDLLELVRANLGAYLSILNFFALDPGVKSRQVDILCLSFLNPVVVVACIS